jgi:hypothetical protein
VRHEHGATAIDQAERAAPAITGTPQPAPAHPSFGSDQYDWSLQYVGSHDADCDIVLRGNLTWLRRGCWRASRAPDGSPPCSSSTTGRT